MFIDNLEIDNFKKPVLIAEMSGNHNQSIEKALKIVDAAAESGADILKLQTYTADTMTLDLHEGDFFISDPTSLWKGQSMHKLYESAYTPWEWHEQIMKRAREKGMSCFSSPFDESAVDFLEELNVPAYKIASFENNHFPLIKKVAQTGKPVIISTGMATMKELAEIIDLLKENKCRDFVLLKCTSTYPASPMNSNILTIPNMINELKCNVGLSDHTLGIGAALAGISHGACIVEKHFNLDRNDGGIDAEFSMEPSQFKILSEEIERAWYSLGKVFYGPTEAEKYAVNKRRSIYLCNDLNKGDKLSAENLKIVRPGFGLSPKEFDRVIGKKLKFDSKKGTPLSWEIIE